MIASSRSGGSSVREVAWWMAGSILLGVSLATAMGDEPRTPLPQERFLIVPLRVHVLASRTLADADCALTDVDLERILAKVNRIWHQAGIHFGVESIVHEEAAGVSRFQNLRVLSDGPLPLGLYRGLLPGSSRSPGLLHVYYLHELPVNGVYLGEGTAIVKETAQLRAVEGGIDEPLPRVTAHELGHALGLAHHREESHLLASGTTGFALGVNEVVRAREGALEWGGRRLADLEVWAERTEAQGDVKHAAVYRTWMAQVPRQEEGTRATVPPRP